MQARVGIILTLTLLTLLATLLFVSMAAAIRIDWSGGWAHPSPVSSEMPEQDFANLWLAGHIARLGHLEWLYEPRLFESWRNHAFGGKLAAEPWIYPPTVLLLGIPLSFLSLVMAFLLWNVATLLVAVLALRHARLPWSILLVGLGAPATWRSLAFGQYGVITGALVVAGLLLAPRHPVRAGLMVGLCTLKPQPALTVPIAWLAARNWRAIGIAALLFAVMGAAITLCFGSRAWMLFFTQARLSMRSLVEAPPPQPYMMSGASVFWMARTLGSGIPAAYALQGLSAASAALLAYKAWRLPDADPLARMAVTVCLSLLVTPYGYTSDMVAYSIAATTIVACNGWRIRLLDGLLWLWPGYCPVVYNLTGMLFTPVAVVVVAALAWRQMPSRSGAA